MARALGLVLLGAGAWLGLSALGGCNSLLDIEEAHEQASAGKTGTAGAGSGSACTQVIAKTSCDTPQDGCSACLARECASQKVSCLQVPW